MKKKPELVKAQKYLDSVEPTEIKRRRVENNHKYAKSKPWIIGLEIHRSPTNEDPKCKICSKKTGIKLFKNYPEGEMDLPPYHHKCLCMITHVIDKKKLGID